MVSPDVRAVILSFGLNNWASNNSSLVEQQVNQLVEMVQNTFPNAKIQWAALNWSPQLPLATQANLARINNNIYRTGKALDPLAKCHFNTEQDSTGPLPQGSVNGNNGCPTLTYK